MAARILIIEDNPTNLELMRYLLHASGHILFTASDGSEGIETARHANPDLIVCDIQMPDLDGYEVARRLKKDPVLRAVPLVTVTSYAMAGDRDAAVAAGFDGYLTKPIAPETFVSQLEVFLRPGQGQSSPPLAAEAQAAPQPAPEITPTRASILIVDDSPANLALMRSVLEPFGYQVTTAGGVAKALALAREAAPDLIVSGPHAAMRDGLALVREIRAGPALRMMPLVMIASAAWNERERREALEYGASRLLVRPIEPEALVSEIEGCLRERN
jgi:two-component system, cell cycle response regulator